LLLFLKMNVAVEVPHLIEDIKRLGSVNKEGKVSVKFGVLFNDDRVANTYESLLGVLKSGKKQGKLTFKGELLLQRVHDDVDVVVLE